MGGGGRRARELNSSSANKRMQTTDETVPIVATKLNDDDRVLPGLTEMQKNKKITCRHHHQPMKLKLFATTIVVIVTLAANLSTNGGRLSLTTVAVVDALEPNWLIGRSFSLTSRVSYRDLRAYAESPKFFGYIHESYSVEQKRATISFKGSSKLVGTRDWSADTLVTFYLDAERGFAFLVNGTGYYDCKEYNAEYLNRLFGEEATYKDVPLLKNQLVVGPARFMLHADEHRDELALQPINVRDFSNTFLSQYTTIINKRSDFRVYYPTFARDDAHKDSVPARIQLWVDRTTTQVDFSSVKLLSSAYCNPTADIGFATQGQVDNGDDCQDRFMFPTRNKCSRLLMDSLGEELFFERAANTAKFSFRARVQRLSLATDDNMTPDATQLFVAYDGQLNSLRVDSSNDLFGQRRQVINFRLNRVYHTVERRRFTSTFSALAGVLDHGRDPAAAASRPDAQCQVARLSPSDPSEQAVFLNPYSVGQLLAGADKFVYMGRAQVRGINARVYEAQGDRVAAPIWLDPPMEFMETAAVADSSGSRIKSRLRTPERGPTETEPQNELAVLVYVGDTDFESPLLKLEIHRIGRKGPEANVEERQTITIEDFTWDLVDSPAGERTSQLFSLSNLCSAGDSEGANQYARIDMLLQQTTKPALSDSPAVRDLALLAGLQDTYRLPATMIYDFESKLLRPSRTGPRTAGSREPDASMSQGLVSFRIADHSNRFVEPIYLGQARKYSPDAVKRAHIRQAALSFSDCFFLAAHRGSNVYFGYEPLRRLCLVDLEGASPPPSKDDADGAASLQQRRPDDTPMGLKLEAGQAMEMYRTNHSTDLGYSRAASWLKDQESASQRLNHLGIEFKVYDTKSRSYLKLRITGVHVDERDYKPSLAIGGGSGDKSKKETTHIVPDKISGFGLSASDQVNNRLVEPAPLLQNTTDWLAPRPLPQALSVDTDDEQEFGRPPSSAMTYEQCRVACLTDFECQSFSLCVKDSRFVCIVSRFSFKSLDVIEQLQTHKSRAGNSTQTGGRRQSRAKVVKVQLGANIDEQVELVQSRSCVLYNKMSIQLFQRPKPDHLAYSNRRARPVGGAEDCADLCVRQNIQLFREDIEQVAKWRSTLWPAANDRTKAAAAPNHHHWQSQSDEHQRTAKELCSAFLYLDETVLMNLESDQLISLQERIVGHEDKAKMDYAKGLCFVNEHLSPQEEAELRESGKLVTGDAGKIARKPRYVTVNSYSFKVADLFYEKHYGIWLGQSPMSLTEMQAYRRARGQAPIGGGKHPSDPQAGMVALMSLLERGDNFRESAPLDELRCASACFSQMFGPWPACRSFDLVIDYDQHTGNIRSVRCHLNSITMRQAKATNRLDLIHETDSARSAQEHPRLKQLWHYEPRAGFVFDGSSARYAGTPQDMAAQLHHEPATSGNDSIKLYTFALWMVLLLGIASGLLVGVTLGQRVLKHVGGGRSRDTEAEKIIEHDAMEFINQINLGSLPQSSGSRGL